MNLFERIIFFFKGTLPESAIPTCYGIYHICCIVICIAITVLLCVFKKDVKEKTYRKIVFIAWLIIFVLETIKQLSQSISYDADTNIVSWGYPWYLFPFQLCSSPLYLFFLIAVLKDGKVRDSIIAFTSTYVMFAGITVFAYPGNVFCATTYLDFQTMVHHGSQVVIGIYSLVYYRDRLNMKYFLNGTPTFIVFIGIAIALNEIMPVVIKDLGYFDMFYISRRYRSVVPIMCDIYDALFNSDLPWYIDYVIYILCYMVGFSIGAAIMASIPLIIKKKKVA